MPKLWISFSGVGVFNSFCIYNISLFLYFYIYLHDCHKDQTDLEAIGINISFAYISCTLAQAPTPSTLFLNWCSQSFIRDNEFISWLGADSDFHGLNWYESIPPGLGICLNCILVLEQNHCFHSISSPLYLPKWFSFLPHSSTCQLENRSYSFVWDSGHNPGTIFQVINEPC